MHERFLDAPALAVAFSAKPQAIAVFADPSRDVDQRAVRGAALLPLETIDEHEVVDGVVVQMMTGDVGKRRLTIDIRYWSDERRQLTRLLHHRRVIVHAQIGR